MKIRARHIWIIIGSLFAGFLLVVMGLGLGFPYRLFPGRNRQSIPVQADDPIRRSHEILVRMDRAYAARLRSMQELRVAHLAISQFASAEDEVLSGVAYILATSPDAVKASRSARDRLTTLSAQIGDVLGRAGLDMGPAMSPQLIRSRARNPVTQREIGGRVYQLQFAACVDAILASMAATQSQKESPSEVSK